MDANTLMGLAVYALPLLVARGIFSLRRGRLERRTREGIERARSEGLDVPPSIHPYINPSSCLGCAMCLKACPENDVLGIVGNRAVLVNGADCIGHGACKDACPSSAITLVLGTKEHGVEVPVLAANFETNLPGVFVAGELGGMGLIRNAIEQGRQVIDSVRRLPGVGTGDQHDVVIIGAGPAGFAATLAAREHGLRSRTLEQDTLGGAVAHFPRRKLVLTAPVVLPLVGQVSLRETTKEALLELWKKTERSTGVDISYGEKVTGVERSGAGFVVTSTTEKIRCRAVVLAIGRRGSPRRLGVPGESLSKVVYLLEDPEDHRGSRVLVVGAGDSALEAAISLSDVPGTKVTLSCRGDAFPRAKAQNRAKLEEREKGRRIQVVRKSSVEKVDADSVILQTPDRRGRIGNDAVIVCVGGELPFGFLRDVGVETEMKHGEP
jgi:thioredoxin reductase (NADPH)